MDGTPPGKQHGPGKRSFLQQHSHQRPGSLNAGILWIIFTATSSGMQGGDLVPGTVFLTNNLYVLHGVNTWWQLMDPNKFVMKNNIVATYYGSADPRYVNLGFANIEGNSPQDFDLADPDSPAVDAGAGIEGERTGLLQSNTPDRRCA